MSLPKYLFWQALIIFSINFLTKINIIILFYYIKFINYTYNNQLLFLIF